MRVAPFLLAVALVAGCAEDAPAPADAPLDDVVEAAPAPPDPGMAPGDDPAPDAPEPPADAPADAEPVYDEMAYRIVGAQVGDRACYLDLEPEAGGPVETYAADFEVCDRVEDEGLTGRLVTYTMETASIQAASCEGDPDCQDSDEVDLVTAIDLVD